MKLLTITPFLKAEIKARNINGKGGAILHQAHPFRTYPKGFMPWVGLAISIYSESQKFSIQEFQVVAYQDNNEISRESRVFDEDMQKYNHKYMRRLNVLPGITGLLQINERNAPEFETWYKYDLQYIENWSLYLDFKIIIQTPISLFSKHTKGV